MRSVEQLRKALQAKPDGDFDADSTLRQALLAELAKHRGAALSAMPDVLMQLEHGDSAVHDAVMAVLRALDGSAASKAIVEFATAKRTRKAGVTALQMIAMHYDGIAALTRGFGLGHRPQPLKDALRSAIPLLVATVEDGKSGDELVRAKAAYALGIFGAGDDAAFAALERAVTDKSPMVRDRTAYALRFFGKRATAALKELKRDFGEADQTAAKSLRWIEDNASAATPAKRATTAKRATNARTEKRRFK